MYPAFKKNWLKKTWWKFTNYERYKLYKHQLYYHNTYHRIHKFTDDNKDLTISDIFDNINNAGEINLVHSGNAGDIIYSLPVVKKLHEITGMPVNYMLKLNEPMEVPPGETHPLGKVMLDEAMAGSLTGLLDSQPYIDKTVIYEGQDVHLDLSSFRESGIELSMSNIARWNFYTTGINANLSEPWLNVEPNPDFSDSIVLARSSRYNNPLINYSFLSEYENIVFIGVRSEYEQMKKSIAGLQWRPVNNFLEMAEVINGSKLFIGNQSFPFSVAEGLKAVRILEVYPIIPNVIPEGADGYDFCFQKHFEYLVGALTEKKAVYA